MKDVLVLVHSLRMVRSTPLQVVTTVKLSIGSLLVSGGYDLNVNIYTTDQNKLKLGLKVCTGVLSTSFDCGFD